MSFARKLKGNVEGTAIVEFAMLGLPFILLILGSIQVMIVMLTQQQIETAAEALGRQILTGTVQQAGMTKQQFATLACSLLPTTLDCKKLIIDVQTAPAFSSAVVTKPDLSGIGNPTATTVLGYNTGNAGQIVVLRVIYALPVISLPGLNLQSSMSSYGFNFPMATSVFKNENYS